MFTDCGKFGIILWVSCVLKHHGMGIGIGIGIGEGCSDSKGGYIGKQL